MLRMSKQTKAHHDRTPPDMALPASWAALGAQRFVQASPDGVSSQTSAAAIGRNARRTVGTQHQRPTRNPGALSGSADQNKEVACNCRLRTRWCRRRSSSSVVAVRFLYPHPPGIFLHHRCLDARPTRAVPVAIALARCASITFAFSQKTASLEMAHYDLSKGRITFRHEHVSDFRAHQEAWPSARRRDRHGAGASADKGTQFVV